jgi:hypothetical protein
MIVFIIEKKKGKINPTQEFGVNVAIIAIIAIKFKSLKVLSFDSSSK